MRYEAGLLPPLGHDGILLAAPGGNTGDDLIRSGCEHFLRESGLKVWSSDGSVERAVAKGDDEYLDGALGSFTGFVFFSGGGNIGIYPDNERLRESVIGSARRARGILVFPQSCLRPEKALRDRRVTVWARDATSESLLRKGNISTRLVPDAAFAMADTIERIPDGDGTFFILRAPGVCLERVDHPIEVEGPHEDLTHRTPLSDVVARLAVWKYVVSDRLHGGIISIMMGKRTALLPVNYHKISSFYETWFRADSGVAFVSTQADLDAFLQGEEHPGIDLAQLFHERASMAWRAFLDGVARR